MSAAEELQPLHNAVVQAGGQDIEIASDEIRFAKNGADWSVVAIARGATYPYILFQNGHRILSFVNPESLVNFFNASKHEKEAETETAEKA
jgi:hypothetical protein